MKKILYIGISDYEKNFFSNYTPKNYEIIFNLENLRHNDFDEVEIISIFNIDYIDASFISKFRNLKFIATRSVGFSHIDIDYCAKNGIKVANAPHYGNRTIAEFTFGLILSLVRYIPKSNNDLKNSKIQMDKYMGSELTKKTIGVLGVGAIGKEIVKIARCFEMNVLGYDLYSDLDFAKKNNITYTDIETLLKNSDIVSINMPFTKENFHLIDKSKIKLMKKNAFLINTARGEIVDVEALYEALKNNKIKGAALDVLECENNIFQDEDFLAESFDEYNLECLKKTFINNKMLFLDNVIITPHIAYYTKEAVQRILEITLNNIKNFIENNFSEINFVK